MADFKMKAREYRPGFMYWLSPNPQQGMKRQIVPAIYVKTEIKEEKHIHYFQVFGRAGAIGFEESSFDTDGMINLKYEGKKWQ